MKAQKLFAGTLVGLGLVFATLFAAPLPPRWGDFSAAAGAMIIGLIYLRILTKKELRSLQQEMGGSNDLLDLLKRAKSDVQGFLKKLQMQGNHPDIHLTDELAETQVDLFAPVSENRDQLIDRYGVKHYADLMIPFAMAERYFNRSVSAAMDGYFDEAIRSLESCLPFLDEAIKKTNWR